MPARLYLLLTDRLATSVRENRDFINRYGWTSWTPQDLSLEGSLKSSMERRRRLHRSSTASGGLGWFWRWWGLPLLPQWSWCYQHSSQRHVHTRWLFCTLHLHGARCVIVLHLYKYTCTVRVVQSCGRLWWESRSPPIINRRLLTLLLVDQILNEGLEPLNILCVLNIKVSFRVIQHVARFMSGFPLVSKTALTLTAYSIRLRILHNGAFLIFLTTLIRIWREENKRRTIVD